MRKTKVPMNTTSSFPPGTPLEEVVATRDQNASLALAAVKRVKNEVAQMVGSAAHHLGIKTGEKQHG